jgi:F-type H+-transporting ATPase subunit c
MNASVALGWALPIGLGMAALGCGLGIGRAVAAAMDAVARQPEAGNKILMYMTIGCAFIEALTIYVLVFAFYALQSAGK